MSIHALSRLFGEHHRGAVSLSALRSSDGRDEVGTPPAAWLEDGSRQIVCELKRPPIPPQVRAEREFLSAPFPQWLG